MIIGQTPGGFYFAGDTLVPAESKPLQYPRGDGVMVTQHDWPEIPAHELSHLFGRVHGDTKECGGNSNGEVGEDLTGDGYGTLDGVGFDTETGKPRGLAPPDLGARLPNLDSYWDMMSYCQPYHFGGSRGGCCLWQSIRGWEQDIQLLRALAFLTQRLGAAPATAAGTARLVPSEPGSARAAAATFLRVLAVATPGATAILRVNRFAGRPRPAPGSSPFTAVARDRAGRVLASVPMRVEKTGDDASLMLEADLPVAARAIEVTRRGAVVARRLASRSRPRVRVLAPRRGQRVGRRSAIAVRLRASDPDRDPLRMTIEYSIDGGRRWRPIYAGAPSARVRLPGRLLAGSRRARIRVRVNDGFHETAARSAIFRAAGSPPDVIIRSPLRGRRVRADEPLVLSAQAYDDRGEWIRSRRRYRWFDGRRRIARGPQAMVAGLRGGRRRIRVVALDRRGRRGSAAVIVRVTRVRPQLIGLRAPARIRRRARSLALRVRTSVPTLLRPTGADVVRRARRCRRTRGGRRSCRRVPVRFAVSRRMRPVRLRVRAGSRPLAIALRLGSGRLSTVVPLVIRR